MMKRFKSFITDSDGFSAKDFLMVIFTCAYILEQVFAFILSLTGRVNSDSLVIIRSLDTIVLTIIGGVFGVQAVREFKSTPDIEYEYHEEKSVSEEEIYDDTDPRK